MRNESIRAMLVVMLTSLSSLAQSHDEPYSFTTLAGGGGFRTNLPGSAARFWWPIAVAMDAAGNAYVADQGNHSISKVTPDGTVTTFAGRSGAAGSANGAGTAARFNLPSGAAVDREGNVFIADTLNNSIRRVTPAGVVSTLAGQAGSRGGADGSGSAAQFNEPFGVALDSAGNVYVADTWNHTIRKVSRAGVVTTLAGVAGSPGSADGTGEAARLNGPNGLVVDSATNIYVADTFNHTIRMLKPVGTEWEVTTLAGEAGSSGKDDGTNHDARFNEPNGMSLDGAGNLYVVEWANHTIRRLTPDDGNWVVTTLAGSAGNLGSADGKSNDARFNNPAGIALDSAGDFYIADAANHLVRRVKRTGTDWAVTTLAGLGGNSGSTDGVRTSARFKGPSGVAVDGSGTLYVADHLNHTIRSVSPGRGIVSTTAGLPGYGGSAGGTPDTTRLGGPFGVAVDSAGNVYVAETVNCTIRRITPSGEVTTLAGQPGVLGGDDGSNGDATFQYPQGIAVDKSGSLYVADSSGYTIRKVTPVGTDWVVTTLAGRYYTFGSQNGTGTGARFNLPTGVAVDRAGNVFVADTLNHLIRKVTPAGVVTTFAGGAGVPGDADGTGTAARFYAPMGVAVDSEDNVYVADTYNNTIRKVTPTRVVTTLGGLAGTLGTADGTGDAARFTNPAGVAVDNAGNLYVTDFYFNTVRKGVLRPRILNEGFDSGRISFDLAGPTGRMVVVEASTDLANWLPVWTNVLGAGPLQFTDPQSGDLASRFYRANLR